MGTQKKYLQWVIIRKFKWVWAHVRVLYYLAAQPAYTYLYNMINDLVIFGI